MSISSILANIYLSDADKKFLQKKNVEYFRYVDDILILCNEKDKHRLMNSIKKEFKDKLKLEVNEKEDQGLITKGFDYLGYKYKKINKIKNIYGFSVKNRNLLKLENSLVEIFSDYKNNKNGQVFLWKLNLRITGFILDNKKYGWLFFYSQIDDLSILYHLDWFINNKLCTINNIKPNVKKRIKKFVTTYFEIIKKRGRSNYIPRAEDFSISEQKRILVDVFEFTSNTIESLSDEQIRIAFKNKMYISVKELERDVQSIS
ncbi:reverse transcriptase domain-containing protein [Paenibacillus oryzisoli]|uniref:reverse transcriptase domain-containing protein n=1 Tax=Paenibacillus oryzisoli TaxID=1850517 RepID=UPI003D2D8040